MYLYQAKDKVILNQRANQFCNQVERYLKGDLNEEVFKSLRLSNGLYLQKYAPMLRVAVPYGLLSSKQFRVFGEVARIYDKGYAHISTRQNIQYNWIELKNIPKVIKKLQSVDLHSIQTSGNVIRNITSDPLAMVSSDETVNPLIYCELLRQYSTLHPEFQYLPRKFKIAVYGAENDRTSAKVHDIGIQIKLNQKNEPIFRILVGGGMGRTPILAKEIVSALPLCDLLNYISAIVRVYNLYGRRDNTYKARIKILVQALGIDNFKKQVNAEFKKIKKSYPKLTQAQVDQIAHSFSDYDYLSQKIDTQSLKKAETKHAFHLSDKNYVLWFNNNVVPHKLPTHRCVYLSLKTSKSKPGDLTSKQFNSLADLADEFNLREIRTTQDQNIVFAHIQLADCFEIYQKLNQLGLATPNINHINNITCCPGLDYCSLADAYTHDIVKDIQLHFEQKDKDYQLKNIRIGISGCINSCAHHHICDIGILGLIKKNVPHYQIRVAGSSNQDAKLAYMIGPAVAREQLIETIEKIITFYQTHRKEKENFHQTFIRLGDRFCQQQLKKIVYH